jgi:iron complex outermembrane receptor protein
MNNRRPVWPGPTGFGFWFAMFFCLIVFPALTGRADTNTTFTGTAQPEDLTQLPLQQLMQIEVPTVFSASKFEQKATAAPSSVTVLTSDEIKRYGWRTLGDILASAQGFYVTYDRNYQYLGARGVNLGDFNSRILVLINGHRINNDLNDGAAIGTAFLLDVDLIDRVEIVRGPGSVLYGDNAFFGVVNVITRQGKQVNGMEASGMYGSYDAWSGRVTLGNQFTNGLQFLLSGTLYHSDGPENLFYPQFNTPTLNVNNGIAHNLDDDGFGSFFGSVNYKDFTVEGGFINREKGNPTAQYLTTFDDSRLRTVDTRGYATVKYAHKFSDTLDVSADVYYDQSDFQIGYPEPITASPPGPVFFKEQETGEWAGGEVQINKKLWDRHQFSLGAEYRNDFFLEDHLYEVDPSPGDVRDVHDRRQNYGIFAQDDFAVVTNLHVNAGVRYDQYYDQYDSFAPAWSPRAALIYSPFSQSTFKFIYGTAFRDPSFFELSELASLNVRPNPEKIISYEVDYEQGIGRHWRSSVAAFYNRMDDLIVIQNGSFTNFNADTLGTELALEGIWEDGIRTRISYSLQHTENRDTGGDLPDSPMHLVKANISVPVYRDKIFAGLELQYVSSSHTIFTDLSGSTQPGPDAPDFVVLNFTLYSHSLVKNLDASASLYNLLGNKYEEPATRFHLQNVIPQDGLTFRVKLTYHF